MLKHYITLLIITIFMVGAVIFGFFNGGSPGYIRGMTIDENTVSRVRSLSYSIESYASTNFKLPPSLEELEKSYPSSTYGTANNVPKVEIQYNIVSNSEYSLCADFETDNQHTADNSRYASSYDQQFLHPKGNHCFKITPTNLKNLNPVNNNIYTYPQPTSYMDSAPPLR